MFARRAYVPVVALAVLAMAATARADLTTSANQASLSGLPTTNTDYAPEAHASAQSASELLGGTLLGPGQSLPDFAPATARLAGGPDPEVLTLPPGPSSGSLLLWALGGFGVWHVGRSARHLQLGAVPEWYHTGGPLQVAHATPLDLDFRLAALPLCIFEPPVTMDDAERAAWHRWLEPNYRIPVQPFLIIADPRGPPSHA